MAARLHDDHCRAHAAGWGPGWPDGCTCTPGRFEERTVVFAAGRTGLIVSIYRGRGGGIRFVVEADDGRQAIFTADQLQQAG